MSAPLNEEKKRGPIAWMAGHSVAANLIMIACLVGGFIALMNIKQEVFPSVDIDAVQITVSYPGASPEEVEQGIILPIEEAVGNVNGIDEITSAARETVGVVTVMAVVGTDLKTLTQDIQSEVDRITTFPDDAEAPNVSAMTHKRQVLSIVLYGDAKDTVLLELGEQIRDTFLQDPGITQVDIEGLPPMEISIEVPQEHLRRYNLTLNDVAAKLKAASVDLPAGGIKTIGGEVLLRIKERRDYGKEFMRLPIITTPDGGEILLGQIANIKDGFEEANQFATYNGKRAIMLNVYRVGNQTPIQVSDAVRKVIKEIIPTLPKGIGLDIRSDRSDIYRQRAELMLKNAAIGLALVFIFLGIFLEARLAFWVMMGIPISFLGSFLLLPATDVTLNMMSMFAYIIALGIVVDDAIVVGENIYRYHQRGEPFLKSAIKGAQEVAMPVIFSVLTNIVTFMPLYFLPGTMGKIQSMIPIVVGLVFLVSLVESLLVLPSHLGHQKERKRKGVFYWLHSKQQVFSHAFTRWVRDYFGPVLDFALRHRYITMAGAICVMVTVSSYAYSGRMGFGLFPKIESDYSQSTLVLPYGSSIKKTEAIVKRILDGANSVIEESGHPELVKGIYARIGHDGSHGATVRVYLADAKIREKIMSTEEFTKKWRAKVGSVVGIKTLQFASDAGGPGHGSSLTIELNHRDINVLQQASRDLAEELRSYSQVSDVDDGFQVGKQQLDFVIKPEGKSLGFNALDVARQVRGSFYGTEVLRQLRGRNEIKIMVRLPEDERDSEYNLEELILLSPAGNHIHLGEIASVKRGRAFTTINRRNGRRVVQVTGDVSPRSKTQEVIAGITPEVLPKIMDRYPGLRYSFQGRQAEMAKSLSSLVVTFGLALLAIFAMLAIPFGSYSQPLIVMFSIPFGVVGAILGHMIMGYDLCLFSLLGVVALSGVVINDSLVLIDFANRSRRDDKTKSAHDIIHQAAITRFRPILLTTLTTFGGLAPMVFETSRQARFLIPMAISLSFGLVFATLITLVMVPSLYMILEDVSVFFKKLRSANEPETRLPATKEVYDEE